MSNFFDTSILQKSKFNSYQEKWRLLDTSISDDALIIGKDVVVERWEKPLQEKMASIVSKRSGKILEIGYGLGIASKEIQKRDPENHIIVESHPVISAKAKKETQHLSHTIVIENFWQNIISNFPSNYFEGILYDPYPLKGSYDGSVEMTFELIEEFLSEAARTLKLNGSLTFLDFSGELIDYTDFQISTTNQHFHSVKEHKLEVDIPQNQDYLKTINPKVIEILK